MITGKRWTYIFLVSACAGGFLWLGLSQAPVSDGFSVCAFKRMWGIPCPACGTTHGVAELLKGNIAGAFGYNPNSFIVAAGLLFIPLCALFDLIMHKDLLYRSYIFFCRIIRKTAVIIPFLLAEILIWCHVLWRHYG